MNTSKWLRGLLGVLVLAFGLGLLLNNVGAADFSGVFRDWWPVLLMLSGVVIVINNARSYLVGLFVFALGALYQLDVSGVIDVEPWSVVWPLLIIFIGLSLVFRRSMVASKVQKADREDVTAILGGVDIVNTSRAFKGSRISAILGGAEVDLRKAVITDGAVVEIFTFWGGVELIVPENVQIKNDVNGILGGVEIKTRQTDDPKQPTLIIAGDAIMGGVSVQNKPDGEKG